MTDITEWKLMPTEPDDKMKEAAFGSIMLGGRGGPITGDFLRQEAALGVYRKMLSAAPANPDMVVISREDAEGMIELLATLKNNRDAAMFTYTDEMRTIFQSRFDRLSKALGETR